MMRLLSTSPALLFATLMTLAAGQQREPLPQVQAVAPPIPVPDWHERDAEGRWSVLRQDVGDEPGAIERWIPFLIDQRASSQLEWIVTSHSLGTAAAIAGLARADASGWLRAADWRLNSLDSHGVGGARTEIEKRPGLFVAWVERHETLVSVSARSLRKRLLAENPGLVLPGPEIVDRYAPPWSPEDLYGPLECADSARPFAGRKRAEPGVLYEQQVLRSMRTLANTGRRTAASCAALLEVALGRNERLGLAATHAFSQFSPSDVPREALLAASADPTLSAGRRESAFLASTYATPAVVFAGLHEIAAQPGHEHWTAALSRLVDLGNGFSVQHLRGVAHMPVLSKAQSALLELQTTTLASRVELEEQDMQAHAQRWLECAACADVLCATIETELRRWTLDTLTAGLAQSGLRERLVHIEKAYVFEGVAPTVFASLDERVKLYARQLLD